MLSALFALAVSIPQTGRLVLPPGTITLARELRIPAGAHDLVIVGDRKGSTFRLAPGFAGRAAIVCEKVTNIRLVGFTIDGHRSAFDQRMALPPSDVRFADFYERDGILADAVEGLSIQRVSFREMPAFAVL